MSVFKPTLKLRWLRKTTWFSSRVQVDLQQRWVNEEGEAEWRDVPVHREHYDPAEKASCEHDWRAPDIGFGTARRSGMKCLTCGEWKATP